MAYDNFKFFNQEDQRQSFPILNCNVNRKKGKKRNGYSIKLKAHIYTVPFRTFNKYF